MPFKYGLLAGILILSGVGIWVAILFLPHWNPRAVIYVIGLIIIIVGYALIREILWHREHPEESKRITKLELESRAQEAKNKAKEDAEKKRRDP